MAGLINQATKKKPALKRAGDANHDPADLASRRDADAGLTSTGRLVQIPLDDLTPSPRNPRDEDLDTDPATAELAASMHQIGQQQPAVVVSREVYLQRWPEDVGRIPTQWVLMIGSRRKAGARKNGWATLECVTREHITPDLEQLGDLAFHENVHRKDINPLRLAFYLADQLEVHGTEAAVAAKVGKTQPWVNQMLKLLKLTPELQGLVKTGDLNASVGRDLARLSRKEQLRVLDAADALTAPQRERFWRTRAWTNQHVATAASGSDHAGSRHTADHSANAAEPSTTSPGATVDKPTSGPQPAVVSAPREVEPTVTKSVGGARAATVRVRVGNAKDTAADLRKHLDTEQLAAVVTELKRKRVGGAAR
jgi:ParB family chromosome partitioning protein